MFRIVHVASLEDSNGFAVYREQAVEIALGPKEAFERGSVGTLARRVAADRVVSALPARQGQPRPPMVPRLPGVARSLRMAREWQALLDSGQARNRADIARRAGLTRARVTQVMGLLRLPPAIQGRILALPPTTGRAKMSERTLRAMTRLAPAGRVLMATMA